MTEGKLLTLESTNRKETVMTDRYDISYGSNYEDTEDLDIPALGRRIKKGIKAMMEAGDIPEMKLSVTTNRSPREVNVKFKSFPEDAPLFQKSKDRFGQEQRVYSDQAKEVQEKVKDYVDTFNYDGSDIQTDYFNVRFYSNVKFDWRFSKKRRKAFEQKG
jgi:hypothetical protein